MKRSFLLATLLVSLGAPAIAADLPVKARPAPVIAEVWNWNGFYIGINGGYSWGRSRTTVDYFSLPTGAAIVPPAGSVTSNDFNLKGGIAGGQAGYNWQSGSWLLGLEADLQWSGERGSGAFLCSATLVGGPCVPGLTFLPAGVVGSALSMDQSIDWFGTFRARAGVLVAPSVVLYATGGLAYGSIKTSGVLASVTPAGAAVSAAFSNSKLNAGWTIGAGIEGHLGGNWTGKLEYLYMDLGTVNNTVSVLTVATTGIGANISSRVTDNIFRAGINYHFSSGPVVARY
jgi:outer membrane immunogenic protein